MEDGIYSFDILFGVSMDSDGYRSWVVLDMNDYKLDFLISEEEYNATIGEVENSKDFKDFFKL